MVAELRPDDLPAAERERLLAGWPKEAEHELNMHHVQFIAFLVVTGRLQGDTEPRPLVDTDIRILEHLANWRDGVAYRDEAPKPGPPYTGGS